MKDIQMLDQTFKVMIQKQKKYQKKYKLKFRRIDFKTKIDDLMFFFMKIVFTKF